MNDFPALLDVTTNELHPLACAREYTAGRNPSLDLTLRDLACSRVQFRLHKVDGGYEVEPISRTSPTYLDGEPLQTRAPLHHGASLHAGNSRFRYLECGDGFERGNPEPTAVLPGPEPTDDCIGARRGVVKTIKMRRGETLVMGRDPLRTSVVLPHPRVSRVHARITRQGDTAVLVDSRSANGTFVNGRRVNGAATVLRGDRIDIGPYALVFDGAKLTPHTRADNVELVARDLRRAVKSPETGAPMTLLDGVSLVVRPREFVCVLGPSGSGKSTLLAALSARTPADEGRVFLNRQDLYSCFDALKQDVAVVSQKDALHESLRVDEALRYTALLRLPPDTRDAEIDDRVREMLKTVGLLKERAKPIKNLSGGQLKRASLANETLSQPNLLFLDEVTSGLDEQTDREMMALFRRLADSGKTVVCVTHSLANVERHCHLVVFLAPEGRLAFVGTPAEALAYFDVERLGDVYELLLDPEVSPDDWKERFIGSPLYQTYVAGRLEGQPDTAPEPAPRPGATFRDWSRTFRHQFATLTERYLAVQLADRRALATMLMQCLVVAALLVLLFGDLGELNKGPGRDPLRLRDPSSLVFLMAVSCFWFGCNNAAKEVVKERVIYERETDVNLQVSSYYASKAALLGAFSAAQAALLFGLVSMFCAPPGNGPEQWVFLTALSACGVATGLLISATATSEEVAVSLVPIALIPQIILSGMIAPLEGVCLWMAKLSVTSYWGVQGLRGLFPEHLQRAVPGDVPGVGGALAVVGLHVVTLIAAALLVLRTLDRCANLRGTSLDAWLARAKVKARGAWQQSLRPPAVRAAQQFSKLVCLLFTT
jgi:ABC-type multidrug transport system ATPase subunit/pSer/pThr/pTyr-binding forkhead associated (FHA) protein